MSITVSLQFGTIAEAAAFFAGKLQAAEPVITAPPAQAPALTPPTVEEAAAAVPETKAIDFDSVVEVLKTYSKRVEPAEFKAYLATLKISKVTDLKTKPDMWAAITAHCNG